MNGRARATCGVRGMRLTSHVHAAPASRALTLMLQAALRYMSDSCRNMIGQG